MSEKDYDYFESYIGIAKEMRDGKNTSATFEVWVDGVCQYTSDIFYGDTASEFVKVPITGAKEVKLVTTAGPSNNNAQDHTVWADAKFTKNTSKPVLDIPTLTTKVGEPLDVTKGYKATDVEDGDLTAKVVVKGAEAINYKRAGKYDVTYEVTDSDGHTTSETRQVAVVNMDDYKYASDVKWQSTSNSYRAPQLDLATGGTNPLRLTTVDGDMVTYEKGIGAHSTSTITYDLTTLDAAYFTSFVGVDRQMYGSVGSVNFQVFVDGVKKFDSGLMTSKMPQQQLEVALAGAKQLQLVVTDGGNGNGSDHATWGDAKFHYANAARLYKDDLVQLATPIDVERYTDDSVARYNEALASAKDVLSAATSQQQIEDAYQVLLDAKQTLVDIDFHEEVHIQDEALKNVLKQALQVETITRGALYTLTSLNAETMGITSLDGLQYAKHLTSLSIANNEVTDFSPLQQLKLETFDGNGQFKDIGSLNGPVAIFDNIVKNKNGHYVKPSQITYSRTNGNTTKMVDVSALPSSPTQLTVDLSNEPKGYYWVGVQYEVDGQQVTLRYLMIHQ